MPEKDHSPEIVGKSGAIQTIKKFIDKVSNTDLPVLIEGESGTGKEMVASAIHKIGERSSQPFIAINCGAMPKDLIENELFGHEAGAFTGATALKRGLFEVAEAGTLFIDEIGELEMLSQTKLLRVIETGIYRRLGGTKELKTNVRIISATNKVLEDQIAEGKFRPDLYYRLSVLRSFLPPLRERKEDIEPLIHNFVSKYKAVKKNYHCEISDEVIEALSSYDWPGNVRELYNVVNRLFVFAEEGKIGIKDVPPELLNKKGTAAPRQSKVPAVSLSEYTDMAQKEFILNTLAANNNSRNLTAKSLKVSRAKLFRILKKLGIQ